MTARFWTVSVGTLVAALVVGMGCWAALAQPRAKPPARYGSVIGLRAEKLAEYKKLHAAVWPAVAKAIREANIRNYSIYLRKLPDGNYYLFGYFEYVGDDFKADMAKMAADPETKRWWTFTDPCQKPLGDRKQGDWWATMEEVFHQD
jgi:L-rhamnose mutarotase